MASAPTPRFRNLSPEAMISVIDNFLGAKDDVDFTEKLAGSNFSATVEPGGGKKYTTKSMKDDPKAPTRGIFPDVEKVLNQLHPDVSSPVTYTFEILKKEKRPDYIDYAMDHDIAAVEFSGKLTPALAAELNAAQSDVYFLTKSDIKKSVGKLIKDDATRARLEAAKAKLESGKISKEDVADVEDTLSDLIDTGMVPSTLGGGRIEGLFGFAGGKGFKIPSKAYAAVQKDQARFYAMTMKGGKMGDRFAAAVESGDPSSDKLIADAVDYLQRLSAGGLPPGFRAFFTPDEAQELLGYYDAMVAGHTKAGKLFASKFFGRIKNKDQWVSSGELKRESRRYRSGLRITETNRPGITVENLRRIVREELEAERTRILVSRVLLRK